MPFNFSLNQAKTVTSSVYPLQCLASSDSLNRVEPLVTAQILRKQYLLGINLMSPLTKQGLTDDDIKDFINRAVNEAEVSLGISVAENVRQYRGPYDRTQNLYYIYTELPYKPVTSILKWSIQSSDGNDIYIFPPSLIETGNAQMGQLSLGFSTVPANSPIIADGFYGNAGYVLIRSLAAYTMPAFYLVQFVTGFPEDKIPLPINELIATIAALAILSMIAPIIRPITSAALNIDGLSQQVTSPGPLWLQQRMAELTAKRDNLIQQLRNYFYTNLVVSNV